MRILIADDDASCRRLLATILERRGYEALTVPDGEAAWSALARADGPRLALLDWMMPGLAGPDVCGRVRAATDLPPTYLILVTARATSGDVATGLASGADDYITKPFERDEVFARLKVGERMLALQTRLAGQVQRLDEQAAALRESEARARAIVDVATDAIALMDGRGVIRDFNPAAERMFGWPRGEAIGRNADVLLPERLRESARREQAAFVERGVARGIGERLDLTAVRRDGQEFPIEWSVGVVEPGALFAVYICDLSERRRLEVELHHAQKLESVGRLAAGIAHEINTPTQFIGDNVRFLADAFASLGRVLAAHRSALATAEDGDAAAPVRAVEEREDVRALEDDIPNALTETLDGVHRIASIVRGMKEFAHPQGDGEMAPADLNRGLQSTLTVARNELKYVADVETDFGDLPSVVCRLGDLNQVFLNLLVNAAHAIADVVGRSGTKGHIRVRTRVDRDAVEVAISDTGGGIPPEARQKIFEPFFTTKAVGRGTGQGLAIARSIVVDRHGGSLTFETEVGKGTTFFIRLPVRPTGATRSEEAA